MKFHYFFVLHRLQLSNIFGLVSPLRILYPSPLSLSLSLSFPSPFHNFPFPPLSFSLGHAESQESHAKPPYRNCPFAGLIPWRYRLPQWGILCRLCDTTQLLYLNSLPSERYYLKINSSLHFGEIRRKGIVLLPTSFLPPLLPVSVLSTVVLFRELFCT